MALLCYAAIGYAPVLSAVVGPGVGAEAQAAPSSQPDTSAACENGITPRGILLRLTTAADRLESIAVLDLLLRVGAIVVAWCLGRKPPAGGVFR